MSEKDNALNNYVTSVIRTWVPLAVGAVISWLVAHGVAVNAGDAATLGAVLTGVFTGVYYAVIRFLEPKFPQIGWLLGLAKAPKYSKNPA